MSAFANLFLSSIAWGGAWHFAAYPIEAIIKKPQWVYITKLTVGVISLYPIVEMFTAKICAMNGMDEAAVNKVRAALFAGYFGAALGYGSGKVIMTGIDPKEH